MIHSSSLGLKQYRILVRNARYVTSIANHKDFYGISLITSKDIAGAFASTSKLPQQKIQRKYDPLIQKRDELANVELELKPNYGAVRFDEDNTPKEHGQYDKTNEATKYRSTDIKQMFAPVEEAVQRSEVEIEEAGMIPDTKDIPNYKPPYRIVDVQPEENIVNILQMFDKAKQPFRDSVIKTNQPPLTFDFIKSTKYQEPVGHTTSTKGESDRSKPKTSKLSGHKLEAEELEESVIESAIGPEAKRTIDYDPEKDQIPLHELDHKSEEYMIRNSEVMSDFTDFDTSYDKKHGEEMSKEHEATKALAYLKQVRASRIEPTAKGLKHRLQEDNPYHFKPQIKLDSKGFRNYSNQVPDWRVIAHDDILTHVKHNIVYHNYEILAVNKPYGIPSHAENFDKDCLNMDKLVAEIAKKFYRLDNVYLAHRLDKTTTGVLLFSTSKERANNLQKLFKSDQVKKTYWCITRGVPDPPAAVIDIPIGEYKVAGKLRSCLAPEEVSEFSQLSRKYREARRAITEYRVIAQQSQSALVEVKPRSGVKHQIRCHLSFGLNKPILGDHKYDDPGRVAPQKLPEPLLRALHVRQSKVRTLPMHLHAKSIMIPGAKSNGETLFIHAPLHSYFIENMKSLKLFSDYVSENMNK